MSVQDSIASQNLSEGNTRTALEMIKLQAQNMRATQAAGVAVRAQDIEQQQNFAGNALKQQGLDEAAKQNAFSRYAEERRLGNEDRGAQRSDYQTYVQGDRKIANDEQQTANALELGKGAQALTARGQDVTMRGQDFSLEEAVMRNQIQQQAVGLQAQELQMKQKAEEMKVAKEQFYQGIMKEQGIDGVLAAKMADADPNVVNGAANAKRTLDAQNEYNAKISDQARLKHAEDYLNTYNNAKTPEEKGAATAAYMMVTDIPPDASPEAVLGAAKNQVVTISKRLGQKFEQGSQGQLSPMDQEYIANMFGRNEKGQPNVSGATAAASVKLSPTDQKKMDKYNEMVQKANEADTDLQGFAGAYNSLPEGSLVKGKGIISRIAQDNPSLVDTASAASGRDQGGTSLREISKFNQRVGMEDKSDGSITGPEVTRLIGMSPNAGSPQSEVDKYVEARAAKNERKRSIGLGAQEWLKSNGSLEGYDEAVNDFISKNPLIDKDGSIQKGNISVRIGTTPEEEAEIKRLEAENAALKSKKGK